MFGKRMKVVLSATALAYLIVTATLSLGAADADKTAPKEKGATIQTPQLAVVQFSNGKSLVGILESVNENDISFKIKGRTNAYKYPFKDIKTIQTANGNIYAYDNDKKILVARNAKDGDTDDPKKDPKDNSKKFEIDLGDKSDKTEKASLQEVVAEGVGKDADEALKDAFRNAVRQVVGAVVNAETMVKNEDIISDKVLTYSDGFISEGYKKLSEKEDNGLFRIKIKAQVKRRSVIAKLKAASVTVKDVDGKGIFADVATQLDAEKNARDLVEKALEGFPFNCLEAEVVGKPLVLKKDESGVEIEITVRVRANEEAYKAFSKKLMATLDGIAKDKSNFLLVADPRRVDADSNGIHVSYPKELSTLIYTVARKRNDKSNGKTPDAQILVAVNNQRTKNNDRTSWALYLLDDSTNQPIKDCGSRKTSAMLRLVNGDGESVAVDSWGVDMRLIGGSPIDYSTPPIWLISPLNSHALRNSAAFAPVKEYKRKIKLTLAELMAVERIKCELSEGNSKTSSPRKANKK